LAKSLLDAKKKDFKDEKEAQAAYQDFLKKFREQVNEEHEKVVAAGGLHVLGTERHESRRIDNQLRGRSGRQGDPGSSRFYVSLEDDLMRLFGSDRIMTVMDKLGMEEGQVIEHPLVTRAIEIAQKRVETHNFEIRKQLIEYDDVMNRQREVIYNMRRSILEGEDLKERVLLAIEETAASAATGHLSAEGAESGWDIEGLTVSLKEKFGFDFKIPKDDIAAMTPGEVSEIIIKTLMEIYEAKEKDLGPQKMRPLERFLLLQTIDSKWKDHLYAMDQMKEGISLRAFGQRDPLIEYKREGFSMFEMMYASINEEVAGMIFKVQLAAAPEKPKSIFSSLPQEFVHRDFTSLSKDAVRPPGAGVLPEGLPEEEPAVSNTPQTFQKAGPKVGRNDPCPCGSGKKYKKCCGQ